MNPFYQATCCIARGGVIAYPTEGVFGLGCNPHNIAAIQRILQIKRRRWEKGLILVAADLTQVTPFLLPLPSTVHDKVVSAWHNGEIVTWLFPVKPAVSRYVRGRFDTLAVRLSQHPPVTKLCQQCGHALISTSANVARNPALIQAAAVRRYFGQQVDYVLPYKVGKLARASQIRDAMTDTVVRA